MNLPRTACTLLYDLALLIQSQVTEKRPLLVCIDGLTGAGKTTLSETLKGYLQIADTPTYSISVDHFHNPRSVRHSLGRLSPEGYYLRSHDYKKLCHLVIEPLRGLGPDYTIIPKAFDLADDRESLAPPCKIQAPAVVIVEGSFMLREELRRFWDFSLYVNVSRVLALSRVTTRDQHLFVLKDGAAIVSQRYHGAHDLHEKLNRPRQHADLCIDNTDPGRPVLTCLRGLRHRRRSVLTGKPLALGVRQLRSDLVSRDRSLPTDADLRIAVWDDRPAAERSAHAFSDAVVEVDRLLGTTGHFIDFGIQCECDGFCEHIAESMSHFFGQATMIFERYL